MQHNQINGRLLDELNRERDRLLDELEREAIHTCQVLAWKNPELAAAICAAAVAKLNGPSPR